MGLALFYRGHGGEALRHLEASIASYRDGDFQLVCRPRARQGIWRGQ